MLVITIILSCYCLLVLVLWMGWNRSIQKGIPGKSGAEELLSVIIAVRNEEQNVEKLLNDLARQHYHNFEVIVVDDHSTDDTLKMLKASRLPQLSVYTNPGTGKKSAITEGVKRAEGVIVVTTDADCAVPPGWLKTINDFFQNADLKFLFGGVRLRQTGSFFSVLQSIEFASLIGSGAATAALGKPTICNGANLAYRKNVFEEVNGYVGNLHVPSGDDEFLMRKVLHRYPGSVRFAGAETAVVDTTARPDMRSFLRQRVRWASKWRYNSSAFSVGLAVFILLSQLASFMCLAGLLTGVSYLLPVMLLVMKALVESVFLIRVCAFLKIPWNWLAFIVLQLVYPLYVMGVGIASGFVPYSWKDRKAR